MKTIEEQINLALIQNWIDKNFEKNSIKIKILDDENFELIDKNLNKIKMNINELE